MTTRSRVGALGLLAGVLVIGTLLGGAAGTFNERRDCEKKHKNGPRMGYVERITRDLELSPEELELVASVVHESLAEFDYFQMVTRDGKAVAMEAPERLIADFQDDHLIIAFESRPKEPLFLDGKLDAVGQFFAKDCVAHLTDPPPVARSCGATW